MQAYASIDERITRFSHLDQAVRIISRIQGCLTKGSQRKPAQSRQDAINALVKSAQSENFSVDIQKLKGAKCVAMQSSISKLDPFLDQKGFLRVGGRLQSSELQSFGERHPLLLPKKSHLTNLIIDYFHRKAAHQGAEKTLALLCTHGYWIPNGRSAVSSRIRGCVTCKRIRGQPCNPQMATLPSVRVNEAPPFTHCGLDCFGPFLVKDGRKEQKRYGLIVTCMASRAVHIELLEDTSTDSFINAIRTVTAIRGPIQSIQCDQGTNFTGASKDLQGNLLTRMNITMKFNPPHSSNMGGVWERQVCSDDLPLSPNMLLTMKSDVVLPPPSDFSDTDFYSRKRWRAVQ
ncbi:uncharacterized protein [Watersipora subatra]|uniref:uncharacterized protein n=1 Tax=Watersipora subatra TaxID=2589382 RepID=UPI00355C48AD